MNQKNSLGLNKCFLDLDDPFQLFERWFAEAKSKEINDPNALALGTANKEGIPSVRMVLLKGFDQNGFIFYTNLFVVVATPEINPRKLRATLSLLRIPEALPFNKAITFPLFTFFPSFVLATKVIFLSEILKAIFAKFNPPTTQF